MVHAEHVRFFHMVGNVGQVLRCPCLGSPLDLCPAVVLDGFHPCMVSSPLGGPSPACSMVVAQQECQKGEDEDVGPLDGLRAFIFYLDCGYCCGF